MRRNQAFRPTVLEALEDRTALSHLGMTASAAISALATMPPPMIRGDFSGQSLGILPGPGLVGAPTKLNLKGMGSVHTLGAFKVTGTITENASIPPPQLSTGTLILSNKGGSITLQISGPLFDPTHTIKPPIEFGFTVTSATGTYASIMTLGPLNGAGLLGLTHVHGPKTGQAPVFPSSFTMRLQITLPTASTTG
jgi:hypothetical protein